MARYIDAEKLIADGWRLERQAPSGKILTVMSIADVPTADVVEVKHGEWLPYETEETYGDDGTIWYKCSECGVDALGRCYEDEWYSYPIKSDYCPKCGADLRTPKERGGEK